MRIEFSTRYGGHDDDVAVEAPHAAVWGDVLPLLAAELGAPHDAPAWLADRLLAPTDQLIGAGLRSGAVVTFGERPPPAPGSGVLSVRVVSGPAAGIVWPLSPGRLTIGRDDACDLRLNDADVSRCHATLDITASAITLRDVGSTNGTCLGGRPVPPGGTRVTPGGLITLGDSTLLVSGPGEPPAVLQHNDDGTSLVLRSPRQVDALPSDEIVLPQPRETTAPRGMHWVAALVPAGAGTLLAWFAHAPQFLLFALLSPVMMLSSAFGDRVHWRRSTRRDAADFRTGRAQVAADVAHRLAAEAVARRRSAPDPTTVGEQAALPGCRLWERRRSDPDLLSVRLGLTELPSALRVRDAGTTRPADVIAAVPACVDLRSGPLGIAGPSGVVDALGRWLVAQVAVLHTPADVEFAFLLDPVRAADWAWARWLPHVRARIATAEDFAASLVADLTAVVEQRLGSQPRDASGWRGGWLVLVVDRVGRMAELPGFGTLLARGAQVGIAVICLDTTVAELPAACTTVARAHAPTGTRLTVRGAGTDAAAPVVIDQVAAPWAEALARNLAALRDASDYDAALPRHCELLDALGLRDLAATAIDDRWQASGGGARVPLGIATDGALDVDLERDGPHALIAGTTGAGKSELLQTLVVGLATNHPPDELNVLLIDYKGGSAFADCARLPHTIGLVTDLDQYLTARALRALRSELRRRERLFETAAARDFREYVTADAREPLPRIVIVVDEFAALADELPDFVRGLVSVAQRGRSLGVHLVLATQRPGAAVSAEIRANTSVRIALRVTDAAESVDVIDAPDAAAIERASPGRGYLRLGGALTCFQGPHATAPHRAAPSAVTVQPLGPWRRAPGSLEVGTDTQLARLVDALRSAAEQLDRRAARPVWLPPLPEQLTLRELDVPAAGTAVAFGMVDLPDEQRSAPLKLDLALGSSLLLAGAPRSGRTGALAAIAVACANRLPPAALHLHVIDATGTLAHVVQPLAHCATLLGPHEADLAPRLLHRLEAEAARRAAGAARAATPGATLVLLIDGWETLCAALPEVDAAHCTERLAGLLRIGPAVGLTVIVAGDRTTLAPRFAGGFADQLLLRMADRTDIAFAGVRPGDVPAILPPGRAVRASDGAVVQLALPGATAEPDAWRSCAADIARRGTPAPRAAAAIIVRPLPTQVGLTELAHVSGRLVVGVGGDRAEPLALDPFAGSRRMLIIGPARSGRSTTLQVLAAQAHAAGMATLVAAPPHSPLAVQARELGLPWVGPAAAGPAAVSAAPSTLVLVDDCEAFTDTVVGDQLNALAREDAEVSIVAAARADDLATCYRGLGVELRRARCGILLQPGPVDGELLGVRLARRPSSGPPGRGVAVGDAAWGTLLSGGEPVPIQVASP